MSRKYLDNTGLTYFWNKVNNKKQNTLVSGTNIKTINNQSLLGSGNISISGGEGSSTKFIDASDSSEWDAQDEEPTQTVLQDIGTHEYQVLVVDNLSGGSGIYLGHVYYLSLKLDAGDVHLRQYVRFEEGDEEENEPTALETWTIGNFDEEAPTTYMFYTGSNEIMKDFKINGVSIASNGTANIVTNTDYNATSNKIATMSDVENSVDLSSYSAGDTISDSTIVAKLKKDNVVVTNDTSKYRLADHSNGTYLYTVMNKLDGGDYILLAESGDNLIVYQKDSTYWQLKIDASNKLSADLISDGNTNKIVTSTEKSTWNGKQDALVSGTNIKTINNESILGSGNITVQSGGGTWGSITGTLSDQTDLQDELDNKVDAYNEDTEEGVSTEITKRPDYIMFDVSNNTELTRTVSRIDDGAIQMYLQDNELNWTGSITMDDNGTFISNNAGTTITDVVTPTTNDMAANKGYVDNKVTTYVDGELSSKQDTLVSGTNIKTINNESILGSGNISVGGGTATDVQINGTSIVNNNTANIVTNTAYNASSNKIATMGDLPIDFFDTGVAIPREADLNDYTTIGKYYASSASAAQSLINCPTTANFVMYVIKRTSDISQIILDLYGHIYTRHSTSSGLPNDWRTVPYDVRINNSSILSGGIANFVTNTAYDSSTNKIATMSDVPIDTNDLTNGAGFITGITSGDVITALGYTPYDSNNPNGYTSNTGTITGITMNGASKGTSGVVNLGTVITSHQDISGKLDTSKVKNAQSTTAGDVYDVRYINTMLGDIENLLGGI